MYTTLNSEGLNEFHYFQAVTPGKKKKKEKTSYFILCLLGPHLWYMEIPRLGVESELQLWVLSVTYTTAHGNTGSPTHWAKTGIIDTSQVY